MRAVLKATRSPTYTNKYLLYLAGVQHVSNSSSAEVSSGDDVLLAT